MIAYAATKTPDGLDILLAKINLYIINPVIEFAFIIAFVIFLWGVFEFIKNADDKDARKKGKDHMLWGIVGFVIMFGVFGIMKLLATTIGVSDADLILTGNQQTFTPPEIIELQYPK